MANNKTPSPAQTKKVAPKAETKSTDVKKEAVKPAALKKDTNAAAPKAAVKAAETKKEVKKPEAVKVAPKEEVKAAAPKQEVKAAEPKKEIKKPEAPKTAVPKIAAPASEVVAKIAAPKGEVKVEAPKKQTPKDNRKMVLFACSEAFPFAGTGGLGEVMGSLPSAINQSSGFEARIILPLYESFPYEERKNLEFVCHINVPLAWRNQYCGLFKYDYKGTTYYFVDNEYYFKRPNLYGYYDDGERFAFFSRAVLEVIPYFDKKPAVLHCQDWQTALVPVYYKLYYMYRENYANIKTIFTIHNIEYQGKYAKSIIEDVFGIAYNEYPSLEHNGSINLMKAAIDYADAISTVSATYAKEIMMEFYAHGLENILIKNSFKLRGILNGIDTDAYNPKTNKALFKNYDERSISDKAVNKKELQKMLSLPESENTPIIAIISRLVTHKGLDLIRGAMDEILRKDVQIVLLGKGDPDFEGYFTHIQKTYDQKVSSIITFNKDLSHKIYAGADMFLMPSKSEPCGLSQMMACRYGTVPIVRATGGLKDSIIDCGAGDSGNGFVFNDYSIAEMLNAIDRAVGLYKDYHDKWDKLVLRAIKTDFSWSVSAKEYIKFYNELY